MHRTVHGFQEITVDFPLFQLVRQFGTTASFVGQVREAVSVNDGWILGVLVIRKVTGGSIQVKFADMGSVDLRVSLLGKFAGNKALQFLTDDGSIGFPKYQALANHLVDVKEPQVPS